ncbi:MAG TPA: hypothetical protein DIT04_05705 [Dysgonomonas sp.]|nr:hypothetical protein [Dysgonomonas sp.]
MRRAFYILSVVSVFLLSSCTASRQYIATEYISTFDYWYLQEKGIFVSESNSVNFAYAPIGSVVVEVRSGGTQSVNLFNGKFSGQSLNAIQEQAKEDVMKRLHEELIALEANGIINVKVQVLMPVHSGQDASYYGPGYSITGMAIQKN